MIALVSHSLISSRVETGPARPSLSASSRLKRSAGKLSRFGSLLRIGVPLVSFVSPSVADSIAGPFVPMTSPSEKFMRHASDKVGRATVSVSTSVGERTCNFMRRRHPSATAINIAADLRGWCFKASTISKMLERQSEPSARLMSAMVCVYGPEFLCAILDRPPAWLDAAQRTTRIETIEARIAALQSERDAIR